MPTHVGHWTQRLPSPFSRWTCCRAQIERERGRERKSTCETRNKLVHKNICANLQKDICPHQLIEKTNSFISQSSSSMLDLNLIVRVYPSFSSLPSSSYVSSSTHSLNVRLYLRVPDTDHVVLTANASLWLQWLHCLHHGPTLTSFEPLPPSPPPPDSDGALPPLTHRISRLHCRLTSLLNLPL